MPSVAIERVDGGRQPIVVGGHTMSAAGILNIANAVDRIGVVSDARRCVRKLVGNVPENPQGSVVVSLSLRDVPLTDEILCYGLEEVTKLDDEVRVAGIFGDECLEELETGQKLVRRPIEFALGQEFDGARLGTGDVLLKAPVPLQATLLFFLAAPLSSVRMIRNCGGESVLGSFERSTPRVSVSTVTFTSAASAATALSFPSRISRILSWPSRSRA